MLIWRSRRGLRSLFLSPLPQGGGSAPSAWYACRGKKIAKQPHALLTFWSDELLNPSVIIPSPSSMNAQDKTRPDDTRARIMDTRSEEHTSELQSRGLISYAVFCLK